ncbi:MULTISPECIES: shikimate kinase [Staphylococcus]|uniref:shikimate kinase n=1 Tax=Staphylococcus TaxID=1279 RepID=UPI0021D1760F|nr:shikimate kinase [Staphylococcus sp. IVB6181]UXV33841.1 shikimate kinase [Staphylococcus sp. IVB6181]
MKFNLEDKVPLIFIGFMGTGKTTLGQYTANQTNSSFVDLDHLIEQRTNQTIPEIFASQGESGFRELETQYLQEAIEQYDIISTGGGIIERPESLELLSKCKNVIWLDTDINLIFDRIKNDANRPNAANKAFAELKRLYLSRVSRYNEIAFSRMDTNKDLDLLHQELMNILNCE